MIGNRKQIPKGSILIRGGIRYKIGEVIGCGGSGLIYGATLDNPSQPSYLRYAIKELFPVGICYRDTLWNVVPKNNGKENLRDSFHYYRKNVKTELEISQKVYTTNFRVMPVLQAYESASLEICVEGTFEIFNVNNTYSIMFDATEQGQTLLQYLKHTNKPIHLKHSIDIMLSICALYARLHQEYIHSDVQAGNIYLMGLSDYDNEPTAVLLDFGSAMELDKNGTAAKREFVFSSDGYCPPEFLFDLGVSYYTPGADVYGLGYLFLSLVKDSPWLVPSRCNDITRYFIANPHIKNVLQGEPIGITDSETLALLNRIIHKAMDVDPGKRYKDAAHMLRDIQELRDCFLLSIDHGLQTSSLRHAAFEFTKRSIDRFNSNGYGFTNVRDFFSLYCTCNGQKKPILEFLSEKDTGIKLLVAPRGSGKRTSISMMYMTLLDSPNRIPLLLDAANLLVELRNSKSYETTIYSALASRYFPHIDRQTAIREIQTYCELRSRQDSLVVIIENIDKIDSSPFLHLAYAAINTLFSRSFGIQLVMTATQIPTVDNVHFDCIGSLEPMDDETIFSAIESTTCKKSQNRYDYITIKEQISFLKRPFFLLRYLYLIAHNDELPLPDSAPQLLEQYFLYVFSSQEDNSCQTFSIYENLPEIGFFLFCSHGECSLDALAKAIGFSKDTLNKVMSSTKILSEIISVKDSQCRFTNDIYMDYFASVYIATHLIQADRLQTSQPLTRINHNTWPLAWIPILENRGYDVPKLLSSLYTLMTKRAHHIPIHIATYFHRKRDKNAYMKWLVLGKKLGNTVALTQLGAEFMTGQIVEKNLSKAKHYLRLAAKKNDRTAIYNLAILYDQQESYRKAIKLYKRAANMGDIDALNNLAYMYGLGRGVTTDHSVAVGYLRDAAEQASPIALFNLARRYYFGVGVREDSATAEHLMVLAAEQDFPPAIQQLVKWYSDYSNAIDFDEDKGAYWIERAKRIGVRLGSL